MNEKTTSFIFFVPYLFKKRHEYMTMYNDIDTTHAADLSYMYYKDFGEYSKTFFTNKDIVNLTVGEFENEEFNIPVNYDIMLKMLYDDYMVLPEESERKIHKIEYSKSD